MFPIFGLGNQGPRGWFADFETCPFWTACESFAEEGKGYCHPYAPGSHNIVLVPLWWLTRLAPSVLQKPFSGARSKRAQLLGGLLAQFQSLNMGFASKRKWYPLWAPHSNRSWRHEGFPMFASLESWDL